MDKRYFSGIEEDHAILELRHTEGQETGARILAAIQKEGLTYEEAYAGLDYAYAALKFSSNFAQIQPDHIRSLQNQLRSEQDRIRSERQ